jgi:hypothetical protein
VVSVWSRAPGQHLRPDPETVGRQRDGGRREAEQRAPGRCPLMSSGAHRCPQATMRRIPADPGRRPTVRDTYAAQTFAGSSVKISSTSSAIRMFSCLPVPNATAKVMAAMVSPNDHLVSNRDHRCADAQRRASSPSGSGRMLHSGDGTFAA